MAKKSSPNTLVLLALAALGLYFLFNNGQTFLGSTVGFTTVGGYSMDVGNDTWTLKVQGTDDYYRITCDNDPISYKWPQDVEQTQKNSFGCWEYRYKKVSTACESGGYCGRYCGNDLVSYSNYGDKCSEDDSLYCRRNCYYTKTIVDEEWSYDNGISWSRSQDAVAAWFAFEKNGQEVAYFGKTTDHNEDWLQSYYRQDRDMEKKRSWSYSSPTGDQATVTNIKYLYSSGGTECYEIKREKICQLYGYTQDGETVCVNWGGDDPTEKYEIFEGCSNTGRDYWIKGDFVVGNKKLSFCQGNSVECREIAKANNDKPYTTECYNTCQQFEVLDFNTCTCYDRSELDIRAADIESPREGLDEDGVLYPGESATITVIVSDLDEIDLDRQFQLEIDAIATEYNPETGTAGGSTAEEMYTWYTE